MGTFLIFFVLVGGLVVVFGLLAAGSNRSQKNMSSGRAKVWQDQTSVSLGQSPPEMGIPMALIPDGGTSGLTASSGSDSGAMVSAPDTSSALSVADMGAVSGGDIGGSFGGDSGSGSVAS